MKESIISQRYREKKKECNTLTKDNLKLFYELEDARRENDKLKKQLKETNLLLGTMIMENKKYSH